jgi:hypothetical protein
VNGYVAAGYAIPTVAVVLYALRVVLRERALRRALPERDT